MRKVYLLTLALTFLGLTTVLADQVTLKNGDRLTGTIVKSDGKTLVLKTEFAGVVTIDWASIENINSGDALNLTLKDGQKVVGKLSSLDTGKIGVETTETGRVELARDAITTIRSKEEEAAYLAEIERLRNPGIMDLWAGSADFGVALTSGNAKTSTLTVGLGAARATPRDKISVFAAGLRASNSTAGRTIRTANAARGGVRYDVNINNKTFGFGFTELDYDEFLLIDFRGVFGGGLGYHAVKNERMTLDLFGGGAYNKTYFAADRVNNKAAFSRDSAEVLFGEELAYKVSGRTSLTQRTVVFPNLSQRGEYRFNFDTTATTALSKYLSWQITFSDRYLSNPPFGRKSNDTLLTTGIRVNFGGK
ncbi:MAG: YdiY family protein [Blastocatellia bacterium]